MPSPYITYALAALSFGLGVAFFRISDENSELVRAKITVEMKLETAEADVKSVREKYMTEVKAREFAEAAQTLAETSELAVRSQLAHETKARQAAEKSLEEVESVRRAMEAELSGAQEQLRILNNKLVEASAATEQSEAGKRAPAPDKASGRQGTEAPSTLAPAAITGQPAAQASMGGAPQRSWFSFLGLFW